MGGALLISIDNNSRTMAPHWGGCTNLTRAVAEGHHWPSAGFGDRRAEIAMAAARLSRLQRRILAWLAAEEQRTRGTMRASHEDLVHALAHDKGNLSHSLGNLEAKGLIKVSRTPGGKKAEAIDLTPRGRQRAAQLTGSCE
jgi:DNA-binding MarR family transcriptional regulator